jgi:pSer/pThr/pTyr-binding forkhead associated (FHA) protein
MQLEYGGQRIVVAAGEILIGSDLSATIRLVGDGVLSRHARVRRTEAGVTVLEPGTGGGTITINGASIGPDPAPLLHGDRIGIGQHEVLVVDPDRAGATRVVAAAAPAAAPSPPLSETSPRSIGRESPARLVCLNDGREYRIAVVPFVLGRDASAEVVIASPDASRRHAEVVRRPDGDVLVDLSTNGTFVNGVRVTGRRELKPLDVIRIGAEEFRYYPAPEPIPSGMPPAGAEFRLSDTLIGLPRRPPTPAPGPTATRPLATMLVKSGSLKGTRLAVRSPVVNIGRAEHNDVRLPDPSISSTHVKLQLREGVWTLADLGSTNGTKVDGEPVADETPLSPGAMVTLGDVNLSFEPHDERPVREDRTAVLSAVAELPPLPPLPPPRVEVQSTELPVQHPPAAKGARSAPPPPRLVPVRQEREPNLIIMAAAIVVLVGLLGVVVFLI